MIDVLNIKIEESDAGNDITIRQYLIALLTELWNEQEGFSGKRPFGNSGWDYELMKPLVKAGVITGSIDEWGFIDKCDTKKGHEIILNAILGLGESK